MTVERLLDWLPPAALLAMGGLAIPRAVVLRRRGVRVLAVAPGSFGRRRTAWEMACDAAMVLVFAYWVWQIIVHALPAHGPVRLAPGWLDARLFDALAVRVVGAVLGVAAVVFYGLGVYTLGGAWRLGIDRRSPGPLVTGGVFAVSRHPIYLAFDLLAVGSLLVYGRVVFGLIAAALAALLHVQALREERFLVEMHGDAYRRYRGRVGRYVTWRGRSEGA